MLAQKKIMVLISIIVFTLGILLGVGFGYYNYVYMPQKNTKTFSEKSYEEMLDMYRAGRVIEVDKEKIKISVEIGKYDKGKEVIFTATPQTMVQIGNETVNTPNAPINLKKYFEPNQNVELLASPNGTIRAIHRELLPGESLK